MNSKEKNETEKISSLIRAARKLAGKNQTEIAQHLGISQSSISKLEKGILLPSVTEWFHFARFVGIPAEESYEFGFIDHAISEQDPKSAAPQEHYPHHHFRIDPLYLKNPGTRIRSLLPLKAVFIERHGKKEWHQKLKDHHLDADVFSVLGFSVGPEVTHLLLKLLNQRQWKDADFAFLAKSQRLNQIHGRLASIYHSSTNGLSMLESYFENESQYDSHFHISNAKRNAKTFSFDWVSSPHWMKSEASEPHHSEAYFEVMKGFWSLLPAMKGLPPLQIRIHPHSAEGIASCSFEASL